VQEQMAKVRKDASQLTQVILEAFCQKLSKGLSLPL